MALRRISHKHTEEQVNRNFDIITNGNMQSSLNMIKKDQQEFLKKPSDTWSNIAPHQTAPASKNSQSAFAQGSDIELQRTQFGERATRVQLLHTQKSHHSAAPKSQHSAAPSSKRSEIRSGGFQKLGADLAK